MLPQMAPAGDDHRPPSGAPCQQGHRHEDGPVKYEIRVEGIIDQSWSQWFDGMQITTESGGETVIAGEVADQATLHGLLTRVRDVGLALVSVLRTDQEAGGTLEP